VRIAVPKAGFVEIPLKLSKPGKAMLHRRHKLPLTLRLEFIPRVGARVLRTERVTLTPLVCPKPLPLGPGARKPKRHRCRSQP
jgi:hypothetical protein